MISVFQSVFQLPTVFNCSGFSTDIRSAVSRDVRSPCPFNKRLTTPEMDTVVIRRYAMWTIGVRITDVRTSGHVYSAESAVTAAAPCSWTDVEIRRNHNESYAISVTRRWPTTVIVVSTFKVNNNGKVLIIVIITNTANRRSTSFWFSNRTSSHCVRSVDNWHVQYTGQYTDGKTNIRKYTFRRYSNDTRCKNIE